MRSKMMPGIEKGPRHEQKYPDHKEKTERLINFKPVFGWPVANRACAAVTIITAQKGAAKGVEFES